MATRRIPVDIVYRTVDAASRKVVDDDPSQHSVQVLVGQARQLLPIPPEQIQRVAVGHYVFGVAVDTSSAVPLITTPTEGVAIEILPTLTYDHHPHCPAGELGGHLLRGHAPGCVEPTDGMVAVHHVSKAAIGNESLRTDAIDDRVIAANALHDTAIAKGGITHETISNSFREDLLQLLLGGHALATDKNGHVLLSSGTGNGQVAIDSGILTARPDSAVVTPKDLSQGLLQLTESLSQIVSNATSPLVRKGDLPRQVAAEDVAAAIANGPLQTFVDHVTRCVNAGAALLQTEHQDDRKAAYETIRTVKESLSNIGNAVGLLTEHLNAMPAVTLAGLSGDDPAIQRLHAMLTDGDGAVLNASLAGNVSGSAQQLGQPAVNQVLNALRELLETETHAEPTATPGSKATILQMLHWVYTLARNARQDFRTPDGKQIEGLRNDAGTTFIARREISQPDATTTTHGKWQG